MSSPSKTYGPILTKLRKVQPQSDAWLWPGRIPLGAITTLIGYGGEGKSFLACSIACAVSRGGPLPDGSLAPRGAVVVMAGEDLPSKLRARYEANGADLDAVTVLEGQRIYTKNGPADVNVTLRDIDLIRAAVEAESAESNSQAEPVQAAPVKLLIIDPIGDFIPGINSDKDNEVRALLNPLAQLAKEKGLAVLLICHRKKGAGDRADNAALGSVAFTSKARAVHHVILDPYDAAHPSERRRFFLPGKLNDQKQSQGLAFKIVAPDGVIEWEKEPIESSADAIMQYAAAKSRAERASDPRALNETESWLREALKHGPRRVSDLVSEAKLEGIQPRTLRDAKFKLGVTHKRLPSQGVYVWTAPANWAESSAGGPPPPATDATPHERAPTPPPATNSGDPNTEPEPEPERYHPAFPPPRIRRRPAA